MRLYSYMDPENIKFLALVKGRMIRTDPDQRASLFFIGMFFFCVRWNGELPALFTQPYLGCLALSPELRALHAGWLETCRPNLLSAYSAMRAEQAQLHTFTRGIY